MRVAISGGSGLLGRWLRQSFMNDGHEVVTITRQRRSPTDIEWDPLRGRIARDALDGMDVVINLAGEPIGAKRWTAAQRERIRVSRVNATNLLANVLAECDDRPPIFVSGSAVGYYGNRGDEVLDERSAPGEDFLATVCVEWEQAAQPARDAGVRVVHPRTGVVLAKEGPLLEKVELPFKLGIGGRIGSGRQFVPWISLDDHVRAMRFLVDSSVEGPVNLVGPTPATNLELTRALGRVLRRPTLLPIPVIAIRALYGEMGASLASVSQHVQPAVLRAHGYEYSYDTLDAALQAVFASPSE